MLYLGLLPAAWVKASEAPNRNGLSGPLLSEIPRRGTVYLTRHYPNYLDTICKMQVKQDKVGKLTTMIGRKLTSEKVVEPRHAGTPTLPEDSGKRSPSEPERFRQSFRYPNYPEGSRHAGRPHGPSEPRPSTYHYECECGQHFGALNSKL